MTGLFFALLRASLSGTAVALGVLLAGPLTRRFFSARWNRAVCVLPLFFFLIPASFSLRLPAAVQKPLSAGATFIPEEAVTVTTVPAQAAAADAALMDRLLPYAVFLWAAGAALYLSGHLIAAACFLRDAKRASVPVGENARRIYK